MDWSINDTDDSVARRHLPYAITGITMSRHAKMRLALYLRTRCEHVRTASGRASSRCSAGPWFAFSQRRGTADANGAWTRSGQETGKSPLHLPNRQWRRARGLGGGPPLPNKVGRGADCGQSPARLGVEAVALRVGVRVCAAPASVNRRGDPSHRMGSPESSAR